MTAAHLLHVLMHTQDHPLFALERHILKYEGIYPKVQIASFNGQEVYPRSAVHTLHTREVWLKVRDDALY